MENREHDIIKPVTERYPDHQWLVKGAFATAVLTSFGGAVIKVWDLFYDNWKKTDLFTDLQETREDAKKDLLKKAKNNSMDRKEFTLEMEEIENSWSKAFNKRLKDTLGIESEGLGMIKGTWQRFDSLGNHTRPKIIFNTVFATAAAIGGYMLINQNAHMKRDMLSMQDRLEKERNPTPSQTPQR